NPVREALTPWMKPGDEKLPGVTPALINADVRPDIHIHPWAASDIHTVKADYAKLRELSLSYSLDKKWLSRFKVESCVLTLQLQNLWTWKRNGRGYDPEAMTTYGYGWGMRTIPNPTTCTIGASIQF
ncbi:MAG: SusC/RagA family TonB-linked outer membrane protein, partial [Bacteroides sp.]|nr:SusC/RagA family TonB-linked outer membrane protein [Bacteroides sp.]